MKLLSTDLPTHPGSNVTWSINGVVAGDGRGLYGTMSLIVGAPPGVGPLCPSASSIELRTEYSSPRSTIDAGKQCRPSSLAFLQGSSRSSSMRFTTRSTDWLTGRGEGEGTGIGGDSEGDERAEGDGE